MSDQRALQIDPGYEPTKMNLQGAFLRRQADATKK
jgi:hypothetical protein